MFRLLVVITAFALSPAIQAQPQTYAKGDIVRLVAPATGDPLPDSRVIAVAGDRIEVGKSGILVNGETVQGISQQMLDQFAEPWAQVVPDGHYFVIGERQEQSAVVRYNGLIPRDKIARKVR